MKAIARKIDCIELPNTWKRRNSKHIFIILAKAKIGQEESIGKYKEILKE